MSSVLTTAGKSLIARLQAGEQLVIDRFVFADIPGLDPDAPLDPEGGLPEGSVVYEYAIPEGYRSYMGPDQVVYSAALGSNVGDFSFNWQGLYCSGHGVLLAASSFHPLRKLARNAATGQQGDNLTRNFILKFADARAITGINVQAEVWQMDYTLRLGGIDERERLSNRDIYGRASFLTEAWKLVESEGGYSFSPGLAYVEGLRLPLEEPLALEGAEFPCSLWLDVALRPEGAELTACADVRSAGPDEELADYVSEGPTPCRHYLQKLAALDAQGGITDARDRVGEQGDVLTVVEGKGAWAKPDGLPLLALLYDLSSVAKPGYLNAAENKGLLPRSAFPQAAREIQRRFEAGDTAVVTDQVWQEELAREGVCPKFSIGDGATSFRIPYMPGLYPGAAAVGQQAGQYLGDAIRNITGRIQTTGAVYKGQTAPEGAFGQDTVATRPQGSVSNGGFDFLTFDASNMVPTADVNRPRTAVMTPFVKMHGAATEAGEANIAALIELATELKGRVETLEQTEVRIRYESDWFDIAPSNVYNFSHGIVNLTNPEKYIVKIITRVKTAMNGWAVGDIIDNSYANYNGSSGDVELGATINIDSSNVLIALGNSNDWFTNTKIGGVKNNDKINCQCKILIWG